MIFKHSTNFATFIIATVEHFDAAYYKISFLDTKVNNIYDKLIAAHQSINIFQDLSVLMAMSLCDNFPTFKNSSELIRLYTLFDGTRSSFIFIGIFTFFSRNKQYNILGRNCQYLHWQYHTMVLKRTNVWRNSGCWRHSHAPFLDIRAECSL